MWQVSFSVLSMILNILKERSTSIPICCLDLFSLQVTGGILLFAVGFVIVGLISKIIGCGLMARICRFKGKDALKIGVGMMTRGEVALIVAQKGLSMNLIDPVYFTAVILLIIVSSISTPIVLKFLYSRDKEENGVQTA